MKQIAKKMWALDFGSLGVGEFICPSCGQPVSLQEGTCVHCGYDLVAYRQAHGIQQPPLSSAAAAESSTSFGTIDFGSEALPVAKAARQLAPEEVLEFDATAVAASHVAVEPASPNYAAAATTSHQPTSFAKQPAATSTWTRQTTTTDTWSAAASQTVNSSDVASSETVSAATAGTESLAALVAQVQSNQAVVNQMLAQLQSDQAALRELADSVATSAAAAATSAAMAPRPRHRSWLARLWQRTFRPQKQLPPPK